MYDQEQVQSKQMRAKARRRRLFVMTMLTVLIIWGTYKTVDNMIVANQKQVAIAELEQQLHHEQQLNKMFKKEISNLQDDEYREQKAREQLKMARPGETTFSLPE